MVKISVDKLKGISALPKKLELKFERNGIEEALEVDIYPFTVNEKTEMKIRSTELEAMNKDSNEKSVALEKNAYETVQLILKKSVDGITIDIIKTFPVEWLEEIIQLALSHEGVSKEQFQALKKKGQ